MNYTLACLTLSLSMLTCRADAQTVHTDTVTTAAMIVEKNFMLAYLKALLGRESNYLEIRAPSIETRVCIGKSGKTILTLQDHISEIIVNATRSGKMVKLDLDPERCDESIVQMSDKNSALAR